MARWHFNNMLLFLRYHQEHKILISPRHTQSLIHVQCSFTPQLQYSAITSFYDAHAFLGHTQYQEMRHSSRFCFACPRNNECVFLWKHVIPNLLTTEQNDGITDSPVTGFIKLSHQYRTHDMFILHWESVEMVCHLSINKCCKITLCAILLSLW